MAQAITRLRSLAIDRRDGTGTGPEVDDDRGFHFQAGQFLERDLDNDFGLGPRDQDSLVDHQVEAAEGPMPKDVLDGFPRRRVVPPWIGKSSRPGPALPRPAPPARRRRRSLPRTNAPSGRHQDAGRASLYRSRHWTTGPLSGTRSLACQPAPAPASWRARSSANRASTISSSSPIRTLSSLYSVRPIRWSVTLFSL